MAEPGETTEVTIEPGRQDIVITRDFDAPREVLFRVLTSPQYRPEWWGPSAMRTVVDADDPRPGGRWRYRNITEDGSEHAFHGVYHEVTAPERIVSTLEYAGAPGSVELDTLTLDDLGDGRTRYTSTGLYGSVAERDAMAVPGMAQGVRETLDRLAALVARLRQG